MKTALRLLPALAICALLGACAAPSPKPDSASANGSEAVLKQRAQQRWDDLLDKQAEKAWDYLTPGYRKTITRGKYAAEMNARPVQWGSATVSSVKCEQPDNCLVYVMVDYKVRLPAMAGGSGTGFAPLKERWLHLQDQWYYLPREDGGTAIKATH